jgi:hypothetical protein
MNDPIDKAGSLASGYAGMILDDLLRANDTPRHAAAVASSPLPRKTKTNQAVAAPQASAPPERVREVKGRG